MLVLEHAYFPLHPRGAADHERYEQALESFTREEGVAYLDTTTEHWGSDLFADENHLNGTGAARLTDLVAREIDRLEASGGAW